MPEAIDVSWWQKEFSWHVHERELGNGQGREFSIQSSRGAVNAYPTIPPEFSADWYDREAACRNATAAACVPMILRRLADLHEHMSLYAAVEPGESSTELSFKCSPFCQEIEELFNELNDLAVRQIAEPPP